MFLIAEVIAAPLVAHPAVTLTASDLPPLVLGWALVSAGVVLGWTGLALRALQASGTRA